MSIFGNKLQVSLFGASHEAYIGMTIHNYPAGVKLSLELINRRLKQRVGLNHLTSKRFETDDFEIISGYFNAYTTGAPLTFLVKNQDIRSSDYQKTYGQARPSHADYPLYVKYHGFNDYRGGGTSSGRLTVVLIILGAICEQILVEKNIFVASRMKIISNLEDQEVVITDKHLLTLKEEVFPVIDLDVKEAMLEKIEEVSQQNDSLGGIVETYISNLPIGLGEPFFDSFESIISHLIFSIPGVKGIEFGTGFSLASMMGSKSNDQMEYRDEKVHYLSNHSGGINGGVTNGNLVNFKTAFKPTSSIGLPQASINFLKKTSETIQISGRHDTIFAIKALHVVNALTNYAVLELLNRNDDNDR